MGRFAEFGNNLYTGRTSVPFIPKRRLWLTIAAVLTLLSIAVPFVRGAGSFVDGFNFGIEFRGGSQFQIVDVPEVEDATQIGQSAVAEVVPQAVARVTVIGGSSVRIQTDQLTQPETAAVTAVLAEAYQVPTSDIASSFVGPQWGADITAQALRALVVFIALVMIVMALYFRTWKMSAAAIVSLLQILVITAGVYALVGFEVTPATVIGFLTVLAYSLYDTVVVFDKVRENTSELGEESRRTFAEAVNLAVNQTLVRSINTGVVAALPVASILFIGAFILGADTLRDISLAILVGIIVGTYSSPFVAAPLYTIFRSKDEAVIALDRKTLAQRQKEGAQQELDQQESVS